MWAECAHASIKSTCGCFAAAAAAVDESLASAASDASTGARIDIGLRGAWCG